MRMVKLLHSSMMETKSQEHSFHCPIQDTSASWGDNVPILNMCEYVCVNVRVRACACVMAEGSKTPISQLVSLSPVFPWKVQQSSTDAIHLQVC